MTRTHRLRQPWQTHEQWEEARNRRLRRVEVLCAVLVVVLALGLKWHLDYQQNPVDRELERRDAQIRQLRAAGKGGRL
jgi:hypothetical protein